MAASWRFTGIGQPEFTAPEVSLLVEGSYIRLSSRLREVLLSINYLFYGFQRVIH